MKYTYSMVSIVQTKAANKPNFLARKRSKQLLDSKNVLRYLRRRVKSGANDLVGLDRLLLVDCQTDCSSSQYFSAQLI